jgi:hypothetical protein
MAQQKNLITELNNAVNINELRQSLNANTKITDRDLKVNIAFFDRNYFVNMKLKRAHILTSDGYKAKWRTATESSSAVLFLFVKEYGKNEYQFAGLSVSKQLEEEHLFDKVVEFINDHLTGNHKTIIANGSKYLARAITPVWTDAKRTAAENLLNNARYKAHAVNYFHGTLEFTYFDFRPIKTWTANLAKVWFIDKNNKSDTIKPTVSIYADTLIFKGSYINPPTEDMPFSFYSIGIVFTYQKEKILLIETDSHWTSFIKDFQREQKYSSTEDVSRWKWTKSDGKFVLSSTEGLRDYAKDDKFELFKAVLTSKAAPHLEGSQMPVFHPAYSNTYCNIYASDLARDILFPDMFTSDKSWNRDYAPWGEHKRAAFLHEALTNNTNGHFKSVTFDEAWKYTNAGYVAYLTAYNAAYYNGNILHKHPGHIATCYQTNGYSNYEGANLIQAGAKNTERVIGFVTEVWTMKGGYTITDDENSNVKANLYLGYIIK